MVTFYIHIVFSVTYVLHILTVRTSGSGRHERQLNNLTHAVQIHFTFHSLLGASLQPVGSGHRQLPVND